MTDLIKSYIVIDSSFKDYELLKKYFKLILHKDVNVTPLNESLLKMDEIQVDDFISLRVSISAIKNDLNLNKLVLIESPFYLKDNYEIFNNVNDNSFDLFDVLLSLNDEEIKINFINSILNKVDSSLLITVKNYLELNSSISLVSKTLYMHRNTVLYQINKFINLTEINIKNNNNSALVRYMIYIYNKEKENETL